MKLFRQSRVTESLAYTLLVACVAALGYLTLRLVHRGTPSEEPTSSPPGALVELQNFQTRAELSPNGEQLLISVQIRTTTARPLPVQVIFVAKPGEGSTKHFGVWPTMGAGGLVTSGGHVRGGTSAPSEVMTLTRSWSRVSGAIPQPPNATRYETVVIYVLGEHGEVLLVRPYLVGTR